VTDEVERETELPLALVPGGGEVDPDLEGWKVGMYVNLPSKCLQVYTQSRKANLL